MRLPILHIPKLRCAPADDGPTPDALVDLCDALAARDLLGVGLAGLLAGTLPVDAPPSVLLSTADTRLDSLATWMTTLAHPGYASLLFCAADTLGEDGHLDASDMPLVTGHGIALASRGITGEPLVGMRLGRLREELRDSRERLSEAAGYQVRILAPTPTATGRCFDQLVLREARQAGYTMFLKPGAGRAAVVDTTRPPAPLPYHEWGPSDRPADLADWAAGDLLARGTTRLRGLVDTPRRLWRRFSDE